MSGLTPEGLRRNLVTISKVRVYRNLHRRCYSVQTKGAKGAWRVAFHAQYLTLNGVTFKVYEKARQRTIKTRSKTVHAFVLGNLTDPSDLVFDTSLLTETRRVSYNPFACGEFVTSDGEAVRSARTAYFTPFGVYIGGEADNAYSD